MVLIFWLFMAVSAQAASLQWDYDTSKGEIPPTADVQKSAAMSGPFNTVTTIPSLPSTYTVPTDAYGWYRIQNLGGISNTVEYAAPVMTVDYQAQIDDLSARVSAIEAMLAQPATDNLKAVMLNVDQVEIAGLNCLKLSTTGSGLKRVITCVH